MKKPLENILYIELKSGYSDDGPAWIGKVKYSKSGQTIYFNNKGFKKYGGEAYSNYIDLETGDSYWISGVKKNGEDRHWAGSGKIMIDKKIVDEYLNLTGQKSVDAKRLEIIDIPDEYPIERIKELNNQNP